MKRIGRIIVGGALVLATAGVGTKVFAGQKYNSPVYFYKNSAGQTYAATGSLGAARNSPLGGQLIQCGYLQRNGSTPQVECDANDGAGNTMSCITYNPSQATITAVMGISSVSNVEFEWTPGTYWGTCTAISITNGSGSMVPTN